MINKIQIKGCCGCTACKSICPQNAIQMKQNKEGFFILLSMKIIVLNVVFVQKFVKKLLRLLQIIQ